MSRRLTVTAAALALLAAPAMAQTQSSPPPAGVGAAPPPSAGVTAPQRSDAMPTKQLSDQDRRFLQEATTGGKAEVALGRLAAQKGKEPAVKDFGQKMVQDHTSADQRLSEIVSKAGISPPEASDQKLQADQAKLQRQKGTAFDRAYIQMMVKDHRADVQLFQREASSENPALKRYASETLPTLRNHLSMAEAIEQKMRSGGTSKRSGASTASASDAAGTHRATQGAALSMDQNMSRSARAIHHAAPSDHEADTLNRQELRQLQGG
jgi:putative membrane protein